MRKPLVVSALLLGVGLSAPAQGRMSGKLACGKPDVNSVAEVGDAAGHMMMLQKASCTWPTPFTIGGAKSVSAVDVGVAEARGASGTQHGYSTTTMDNGDKTVVAYSGTMQMKPDGSGTFRGTWRFVSGTGRLEGIKGKGTYVGTGDKDGRGGADIEGHYTIPSSGKTAKKSK